ncbi:MAG: transposase [Bacteroidota bacterium]|nr:transposase [Bacteroidota bacterium]
MIEYKRNLPHILPESGLFFVTFRIHNSLPLDKLVELKSEYKHEIYLTKQRIKNSKILKSRICDLYNDYFHDFDSLLDQYLEEFNLTENQNIANIIKDAIFYLNVKEYKLICFTIMPNHVHLIIYKLKKPLFKIMQVLKGYTSREINKKLNRKGKFWHTESYDNVIRSRNELANKIKYVLDNPVKAGLTNHWKNWEYSYCDPNFLED